MMTQVIGGPLDGLYVAWTDDHVCLKIGEDRYASYHLTPWDECIFEPDGCYHFGLLVTGLVEQGGRFFAVARAEEGY